jgi:hypothetical protein
MPENPATGDVESKFLVRGAYAVEQIVPGPPIKPGCLYRLDWKRPPREIIGSGRCGLVAFVHVVSILACCGNLGGIIRASLNLALLDFWELEAGSHALWIVFFGIALYAEGARLAALQIELPNAAVLFPHPHRPVLRCIRYRVRTRRP